MALNRVRTGVKYWLIILTSISVSLLGAWAFTKASTPMYQSHASLYFSLQLNKSATDLNQGSTYVQSQISSFAELAKSSTVLGPVVEELDLDLTENQVANSLSITTPQNTVIIEVAASSSTGQASADLANAVANSLAQSVERIGPKDTEGKGILVVQSIESAKVPDSPATPNENLNLTTGGLLGLLLGVLAIILWRAYKTKSSTVASEYPVGAGPTLGTVYAEVRKDGAEAYVRDNPSGLEAEEFRRLRQNLRAAMGNPDSLSFVLVPTASNNELTVAYNLGQAFSETGASVLVVDADLRNDARSYPWGRASRPGLTRLLDDISGVLDDVVRTDSGFDFHILPAGGWSQNPGKSLASARMSDLIKAAQGTYEVVIIQTGPVLAAADASVLSGFTKGVVLTVEAGRTKPGQLEDSLEKLEQSGSTVLGVVDVNPPRKRAKKGRRLPHVTWPP